MQQLYRGLLYPKSILLSSNFDLVKTFYLEHNISSKAFITVKASSHLGVYIVYITTSFRLDRFLLEKKVRLVYAQRRWDML